MELYQWYILLSVILIIMEIYAPGFILLPIGIAGLITSVVAYFRPEIWLHAVFFICGSGLALLALSRFRDALDSETKPKGGGFGLIGQTGSIIAMPKDGKPMFVKIFGDTWEVVDGSLSNEALSKLSIGSHVKVTGVVGNKISIEPL